MKTLFLAVLLLTITSVQTSEAAPPKKYSVEAAFYEPMLGVNTIFIGSFTFDSTNSQITNLTGTLSQAMTGPPQQTITLSHNKVASQSDGKGGVLATVFAVDSTDVFWQGGYDWRSGQKTFGNNNAYVTIDVNATNPTSGATDINLLAYADCTPNGLMGVTCMTGYAGGGTMGAYPISETITLLPSPSPTIGLNGSLLTMSLAAGADVGQNADWWLVAQSPMGNWYAYAYPYGWVLLGADLSQITPAYQGPLQNIAEMGIFETSGLPSGQYPRRASDLVYRCR